MIVQLDQNELTLAQYIAENRMSVSADFKDKPGKAPSGTPAAIYGDLVGSHGELVVAKALDCYPYGMLEDWTAAKPDHPTYEVKATHHYNGNLVVMRFQAKKNTRYFLACMIREWDRWDVPGYAHGQELETMHDPQLALKVTGGKLEEARNIWAINREDLHACPTLG